MGKPNPPATPDYQGAALTQGQQNIEAAKQTGIMNNPNVVSPYGTQMVTFDPTTNQPTINQQLNPEQQALLNQTVRTQGLLGGLGQQGAESLQGVVGKPIDFSGAPAAAVPGQINQAYLDAMMQRPTADYARAKDQLGSDLAAGGIPVGSKAWNSQQDLLGRQLTDAQTQASQAAATSGFQQQQAARQQGISENLAARQTPLNEITALLSGSQVTNPFATAPAYSATSNAAPAPVFGATTATGNYASDLYNQKAGLYGNMMSGLFSLGAAGVKGAAAASDRRLKTNIRRLGTHPLGIGIYEYDIFGRRERGVMAQEVLTVKPEAVLTHPDGYLMVDYGRL